MTVQHIEVPKNCRRLVRSYEGQGYMLVPSEHPRHLLRMNFTTQTESTLCEAQVAQTIYITMGRSPLSLVNRDRWAVHIKSAGNKIPHYTAAERKHAADLVFNR